MSEVSMNVLEIDGKDFVLVETVGKYNFFVEDGNKENVCVLKEVEEDNEVLYVNLDEEEFDYAFNLYYEKLKGTN